MPKRTIRVNLFDASSIRRLLPVLLTLFVGATTLVGSGGAAHAAAGVVSGCRASIVRVGTDYFGPVANRDTSPCIEDSEDSYSQTLTFGPAGLFTLRVYGPSAFTAPYAFPTAVGANLNAQGTQVALFFLGIPVLNALDVISSASAHMTPTCTDMQFSGGSSVGELIIFGKLTHNDTTPRSMQLAPGLWLHVNWVVQQDNVLTSRAFWIENGPGDSGDRIDISIAESRVALRCDSSG